MHAGANEPRAIMRKQHGPAVMGAAMGIVTTIAAGWPCRVASPVVAWCSSPRIEGASHARSTISKLCGARATWLASSKRTLTRCCDWRGTEDVSTIVFVEMPAFGHVNPSLPLARELVRRGECVIYYNDAEFSQAVSAGSGAEFRPYPPGVVTSAMIARATQTGDLIRVPRVILRATETLVPFLLERLRADPPVAVVLDSNALWGHIVVRSLMTITHDPRS
jgi:hypothetical protein